MRILARCLAIGGLLGVLASGAHAVDNVTGLKTENSVREFYRAGFTSFNCCYI